MDVVLRFTCFAAGRQVRPALHALSVALLVADVVAEIVVARPTHFVALVSIVVLVAADSHGVLQPRRQALVLHRLLVVAGVHLAFVNAALDEQLVIWRRMRTKT